MTSHDLLQVAAYVIALLTLAPPLGMFMARVFADETHFLKPVLGWLERLIYRTCGCDPDTEMTWKQYAKALLWFKGIGFLLLFGLQVFQRSLPLNPQNLPNVGWALAFNTAVSFVTNTNWRSYAGETTLSYLTQMIGLTGQSSCAARLSVSHPPNTSSCASSRNTPAKWSRKGNC